MTPVHGRIRWIGPLLLAASLGGCATVAPFKGLAITEDTVYVAGLPPVRQDRQFACGAACVAAVAAYWNVPLAQFRARHPQMPEDTTGHDLELLAEDLGLHAFAYRGSMDDLRENLRKGRPLIVMIPQPVLPTGGLTGALLINAWNRWGHKPAHWVVVLGLTADRTVIVHDPDSGPMEIKQELFETWWAQKGNLTLLIAAP